MLPAITTLSSKASPASKSVGFSPRRSPFETKITRYTQAQLDARKKKALRGAQGRGEREVIRESYSSARKQRQATAKADENKAFEPTILSGSVQIAKIRANTGVGHGASAGMQGREEHVLIGSLYTYVKGQK